MTSSPGRGENNAEILLPAGEARLAGTLGLPLGAVGLVAFVHGSGSSRFSSRNRFVAELLQRAGLATLLFDLLTEAEEQVDRLDGSLRFDIPLLAARTVAVVEVLAADPVLGRLPLGLFGASTGAAAALIAAAERPERVRAVVSRGGRPDLAAERLAGVACPTLLIVGGRDEQVLSLNRWAARRLGGPHRIEVVPGAAHLFEEPGTLGRAAALARDWFLLHLPPSREPTGGEPEEGSASGG